MDEKEMTMREARNLALDQALQADDRVFLLGEDIADPGASGPTAGLSTKYGHERVLDTPISEAAILGAAIGAAIDGMRPVAEIMIMDFIGIAADQLINNAAKLRFMTAGRTTAPITVRTQVYGGLATGATHSQSLEAWFMHIPGMKVIVPSTPRDGKGLLTSAIFDEDPCLFVETIRLQGQKGLVPIDPGFSSSRSRRCQTAGRRRHDRQLRAQCAGRTRGGSDAGGAGCERRGRRSAHPRADGRRDDGRVGPPHPTGRGRARRGPIRRPWS
jgi:transketolase C-terminal domain/subunit